LAQKSRILAATNGVRTPPRGIEIIRHMTVPIAASAKTTSSISL
jgi:hypothetical protein